jgi:hypothetical protein
MTLIRKKKTAPPGFVTVEVVVGPWTVERVWRKDADYLYNAVTREGDHVREASLTPTHSKVQAWETASELNRHHHLRAGNEEPETRDVTVWTGH